MRSVKLAICAILWSLCSSLGSAKDGPCFVPAIHIKSLRPDKVPLTRLSMSLNDGTNRPAFLRSADDDLEKSMKRFARMIVGSYSIPMDHHQQDIFGEFLVLYPERQQPMVVDRFDRVLPSSSPGYQERQVQLDCLSASKEGNVAG